MDIKDLNQVLQEMCKTPVLRCVEETNNEQPKRKKKLFFLGERAVESQNPVVFSNGVFFVERTSEYLVIRPKTVREYLKKVRGMDRTMRIERGAKDILIPFREVVENPMKWFEQKYVLNSKRNTQGRFIRQIWKYKKEVFSEVMLG